MLLIIIIARAESCPALGLIAQRRAVNLYQCLVRGQSSQQHPPPCTLTATWSQKLIDAIAVNCPLMPARPKLCWGISCRKQMLRPAALRSSGTPQCSGDCSQWLLAPIVCFGGDYFKFASEPGALGWRGPRSLPTNPVSHLTQDRY